MAAYGWWFFTCKDKILLITQGQGLPYGELSELPLPALDASAAQCFAHYQGEPCWRLEMAHECDLGLGQWLSVRDSMSRLSAELFNLVGRAQQLSLFYETHRFCGRCASEMQAIDWEHAMHCKRCGFRAYPRVSPSIIVLVSQGNKVLLASHRRHQGGFYTTIAGFVEAGETLEQAVAREVFEETGIHVRNVRYWQSQPWPFPHSLMAAFFADFAQGDICIEPKELLDAQWFDLERLPELPSHGTIARAMIEYWRTQNQSLMTK